MRVSSSYKYEVGIASLSNIENKRLSYYEQSSTGLKVNRPSDDPLASSQSVTLNQSLSLNERYEENRSIASHQMELSETAIDSSISVLDEINTVLVAAQSGANSEADYQTYATELKSLYASLLTQANSTDGLGNYIYSGTKGDVPPYEVGDDGFVVDTNGDGGYVGGAEGSQIQIEKTRQIQAGNTGDEIYGSIFSDLESVINDLENYSSDDTIDLSASLNSARESVKSAQDDMNTVKTSLGARMNEVSALDSAGVSKEENYTEQLSDLVNADQVEVLSMLEYYETQYEASLTAFERIQSLHLFGN